MIQYAKDKILPLDEERKAAIKEYLGLQEDFQYLKNLGLCKYFEINYEKEELDVDKLTKEQKTKLDACTPEEREELIKELPKTMQDYSLWAILPNEIQNTLAKILVSIDNIDTPTIKVINERTKARIDLYKEFID